MGGCNAALALLACAALAAGSSARAEGVSTEEMQEMRALVQQLQAQVDAQAEQLGHQGQLLESAREREAASGFPALLADIEFGGWVAASWFANFNNPGEEVMAGAGPGANQGASGSFYPFHPDSNSFAVDQLWFEIERPLSDAHRSGFRVDLVYGKTAGILTGAPDNGASVLDSASDFNLYQAYVQYRTPFGTTLRAGKFGTLLGAEVAQTTQNFNVTRGNVYNLLQPITHYGLVLDGQAGPLSYSLGAVNSGLCCRTERDQNYAKSVLAGLGYAGESFSLGTSVAWGAEDVGDSAGGRGTWDVLASWDPAESFSSWLNFDYAWAQDGVRAWGVALAGRYALTELLGLALRAEWLADRNDFFGFEGAPDHSAVWGVTGTLDYALTEGLRLRAEARWDRVDKDGAPDKEFYDSGSSPEFTRASQVIGGVEVLYEF